MVEPVTIGVAEETSATPPQTEERQKRKYTRRNKVTSQIDPKRQQQLHQLVMMLATAGLLLVPFQYRPLDAELQAILLPLERIYLRHAPDTELNPDVTDCILAVLGIFVYATRIVTTSTRQPRVAQQQPQRANTTENSARPVAEPGSGENNPLRRNGVTSAEDSLAALHRATFRPDTGNG